MNNPGLTPLEVLLFFQCLVTEGTDEQDFERISDHLTNSPFVRDGESYDPRKLTPNALRLTYLDTLNRELVAEEQERQDANSPATSKKRKLPSQPILSVKDALQVRDQIPYVVERLYAQYKTHATEQIRRDEFEFKRIQQEIEELQAAEDERVRREDQTRANPNGAVQPPRPSYNGIPPLPVSQQLRTVPSPTRDSIPPGLPSPRPGSRSEGLAISDVLNSQEQPPAASPRLPDHARVQGYPPNQQRPPSAGPYPPQVHQAATHILQAPTLWPQSSYGSGFTQPGHQQPGHQQSGPPYPPYPQQYGHPPPQGYPAQRQVSFSSSHGLPPPHPHVPSSPINAQHPHIQLPPPNMRLSGMPPNSPANLDVLANTASQQPNQPYRQQTGSPMMQQGPSPQAYQPPFTPQHARPQSGNGLPGQWPQNQQQFIPPYASSQQPYQQFPPAQRPQFTPQANLGQPDRQYNSPYNPSQGPRAIQARCRPSLPSTPLSRGRPVHITGSGTRWTPTILGTSTPSLGGLTAVQRPQVEPLSPVSALASLLEPPQVVEPPRSTGQSKKATKSLSKAKQPPRGRQSGRGGQRTRAGSTASSVIAGSYRSQSVMSHADEMSVDNDHLVKEEVATPIGIAEDAGDDTGDEQSQLPSQSRPSPLKRKRDSSVDLGSSDPPTTVLYVPGFRNLALSTVERIEVHKHANMFLNPIRERDAPGYNNIILRPQNISSVKKAMLAGQNAASHLGLQKKGPPVLVPVSEDIIPPKAIVNSAQLEAQVMLIFANAIMYNGDPDGGLGPKWRQASRGGSAAAGGDALGYQFDEDGLIKDTREIFADAEHEIQEFRSMQYKNEKSAAHWTGPAREDSVARASTVAEDEEMTGDTESQAGNTGTGKRRKKT